MKKNQSKSGDPAKHPAFIHTLELGLIFFQLALSTNFVGPPFAVIQLYLIQIASHLTSLLCFLISRE